MNKIEDINLAAAEANDEWMHLIIQELTHWLQHRLSNYRPTRDTHTHISWSDACWLVAKSLGNEKERIYYRPLISKRDEDGVLRKVQCEGSLTPKELHHCPEPETVALAN